MNHLNQADQQFVPISAVDNIINDIHTINHNIRQINHSDSLHVIVPSLLAETKRSAHIRSQSLPRTSAGPRDVLLNNQRDIAMRLSALHTKVNRYISKSPERSASPVRYTSVTSESILRTPPRNVETVKSSVRPHVITQSPIMPEYKTAQSIEITSPLKSELKKSVTWGNVTDLAVSGVINQAKRAESPLRSPLKSSLANSPTRPLSILRQKSLTESSPVGRGSVGNLGLTSGRSPVKATAALGGSNFTSFVLNSSAGSTSALYDKIKLDNIIAGIKAREAIVQGTRGYGSVSEPRKPVIAQGFGETPRF